MKRSLTIILIMLALSFTYKMNAQADRDTLKLPAKNRLDREVPGMGRPDSSVIQEGKQRSDKQMGKESGSGMMKTEPGVKKDHPDMPQDTMMHQKKQPGMGKPDTGNVQSGMGGRLPGVVAKPDFENTTTDLRMKVWISSVKEQDMMGNNMNNVGNAKEEDNPDLHHIIVELQDPQSGSEITGANVKVQVKSPSNNNSQVELKPVTSQYGGELIMKEPGEYQLSIDVEHNGKTSSAPFRYIRR